MSMNPRNRKIAFSILLMVPVLFSELKACSGQEPVFEEVDVFPAGMGGVSLYRIPGVVTTKSGTVLAYCEARLDGRSDWGEIEIHLRRSKDDGRTWSDPVNIAHKGERIEGNPRKASGGEKEQTVNNPVAIVDRDSGAIQFLYCVNYARCFSMQSTDDGLTWSDPVEITSAFEGFRETYDWKVIATGPGHGIQMPSGRMVVPIWLAYGDVGDHNPSAAATIYSDDAGQSWYAGDIVVPNSPPFHNPNESIATLLSDDRVMLLSRNVSKPNRKIVTASSTGATDWGEPNFHPELKEPVCMASVIRVPSKADLDSAGGNGSHLLLFTCPDRVGRNKAGKEVPGGRGKRENLTIKVSYDDGATWPVSRTIQPGPSAYSDLTVLQSGEVLCLYEGSQTITAARFNREWIESD